MKTSRNKVSLAIICASFCWLVAAAKISLLVAAATTIPIEVTSEVPFTISRSQVQPFIRQLVVESQGRIALDVTGSPKEVELTLSLHRPDGSVANKISGTGGNLSLTYFVTEREVKDSLAMKNSRWSVEINKASNSETVTGRLKITQPLSE